MRAMAPWPKTLLALALTLALAASAHAGESTWYGRPIPEWVERTRDGRDGRQLHQIPWELSPRAMTTWRRILRSSTDPAEVTRAWDVLVRIEPTPVARTMLQEALDGDDGGRRVVAMGQVLSRPREHEALLPRTVDLALHDDPLSTLAGYATAAARFLGADGSMRAPRSEEIAAAWDDPWSTSAAFVVSAAPDLAERELVRSLDAHGYESLPERWAWPLVTDLARRSASAQHVLVRFIREGDPMTATGAAQWAGGLRADDELFAALVEVSQPSRSSDLRHAAIGALSCQGLRPEVVPILAAALDDPDEDVRTLAVRSLGEWGPLARPHVPALVDRAIRSGDDAWRDRDAALAALERLGEDAEPAIGPLSRAVLEPEDRKDSATLASSLAPILGPGRLARDLRSASRPAHERAVRCLLFAPTLGSCTGPSPHVAPLDGVIPAIAAELASPRGDHRRDAASIMGAWRTDIDAFAPAVLAALRHDDEAIRADGGAALAALARGGLTWTAQWTWDELAALVAEPGVLAGLGAGAVECDAEAARALAAIVRDETSPDRAAALRALAWHVGVAHDEVLAAIEAAERSDDEPLRGAAADVRAFGPCFGGTAPARRQVGEALASPRCDGPGSLSSTQQSR